jgi:hypothetical protein
LRAVVTIHPAGVVRDAVGPPPGGGGDERVLDGVLGEGEVAEQPRQGRHGLAVTLSEGALDVVHAGAPS